ncbi:MAG: hypothetical protein WKF43_12730 [Acidimicrobiales bacterium]
MDTLLLALLFLVGITVLAVVMTLLLTLLGIRRLRRRNQVSREEPGDAPLGWLWSPAAAARLHRRLQAAVAVGQVIRQRHAKDSHPPRSVDLACELEREAAALDRHLTLIGRLPPRERRRLLPRFSADVRRVEQLASRLSVLDLESASVARLPQQRGAMDDLAEQLDLLEASRQELRVTEAEVGLHTEPPLPS